MAKDLRFAMLLDCYGEFLTPHQYKVTELYYGADLSLSEIAALLGITRQGVRDGIKRGEQVLQEKEEKLKLEARLCAMSEYDATRSVRMKAISAAVPENAQVQNQCRMAMETIHQGLKLL